MHSYSHVVSGLASFPSSAFVKMLFTMAASLPAGMSTRVASDLTSGSSATGSSATGSSTTGSSATGSSATGSSTTGSSTSGSSTSGSLITVSLTGSVSVTASGVASSVASSANAVRHSDCAISITARKAARSLDYVRFFMFDSFSSVYLYHPAGGLAPVGWRTRIMRLCACKNDFQRYSTQPCMNIAHR